MNETKTQSQTTEIDQRGGTGTLLLMVLVPVIMSLALVATALMFGRPVDAAEVLAGSPELTPMQVGAVETEDVDDGALYWCGDEAATPSRIGLFVYHGSEFGSYYATRSVLGFLGVGEGDVC